MRKKKGMATISTNDIIVNYKLGDVSALTQLSNKFQKISEEEQQVIEKAKDVTAEFKRAGNEGATATNKIKSGVGNINPEMDKMLGSLKSIGAALGIAFSASKLVEFGRMVTQTTIQFQGYQKAIEFASGSAEKYAANQAFLNSTIQKFGLDLRSTTEAYKSFFAASTLAGQSQKDTNAQFLAVTKAGTVLKLTTDQMQGAFLALGQMMSKGTVQAEELRGQLGERIPGAFSIMARALGVNERQLNKMLEQGQVLSRDALPKFAAELEKTFGPAAEQNLNGLVNAQNRFNSAIDGLVLAIGTRLQPFLKGSYDLAAGIANQLTRLYDPIAASFQKGADAGKKASEEALKIAIVNANARIRALKEEFDLRNEIYARDGEMTSLEKQQLDLVSRKYEKQKAFRDGLMTNLERFKQETAVLQTNNDLTAAQLKLLEDNYKKEIQLAETLQKVQLLKVKQTYTNKVDIMTQELLVRERFAAQMFAIDKKYSDMGIEEARRNSMTRLEIVKAERTETIKALADITKSEKDEIQKRMEELNKFDADRGRAQQKSLEDQKQLNKEKAELDQKYAEALKKIEENSAKETQQLQKDLGQMSVQEVEAFVNFAQTMTDGFFSIYQANLQNQMVAMNKQFDEEIRLADGNVQKITEIEEKRAEKEREIRKKQFEAQQMQAIAQVIFNTAPIIAQYLAGVVTAPLAGVAIAAQVAQIGFILAQPMPEFAKGVENFEGGPAIVGEQGRELVRTDKGLFLTPDKATMTYLPKGSDVITAPKTRELLQGNSTFLNRQNQWTAIDTAPIAQAIKAIPVQSLEISERGLERYVTKGNRTTKILNKKRGANL